MYGLDFFACDLLCDMSLIENRYAQIDFDCAYSLVYQWPIALHSLSAHCAKKILWVNLIWFGCILFLLWIYVVFLRVIRLSVCFAIELTVDNSFQRDTLLYKKKWSRLIEIDNLCRFLWVSIRIRHQRNRQVSMKTKLSSCASFKEIFTKLACLLFNWKWLIYCSLFADKSVIVANNLNWFNGPNMRKFYHSLK